MSWLRNSPFRASFSKQSSRVLDVTAEYDPNACYQSFCKHWQQAYDIIVKSQPWNNSMHDDVLGVINHLEQLATLLLLEARNGNYSPQHTIPSPHPPPGACLEYLLCENLLDKLYEWGISTGRYLNVVRLEQLKIYILLTPNYGSQLLGAEPFLRPLLKLLASCQSELLPVDVEDNLVTLLVQLCVVLTQNVKFIELFFLTTLQNHKKDSNFLLVSLLLPLVHRESGEYDVHSGTVGTGGVGAKARNALLLCATISARSPALASALANSNLCPVLATGLSGLYSILPRQLDIIRPEWHRLTPDDINDIDKLTLFMNSLEFCNAVAQVAHPMIKQQLLDFLFQGFLVPVMGPALLQAGKKGEGGGTSLKQACLQSGSAERIAAAAYLELTLRSSTERGLLRTLLHFLLMYRYDGAGILDVLLQRMDTDPTLCLTTLALMETLIDLNCEDVMLELVFKYLSDGSHLMVSHRKSLPENDLFCKAAGTFLSLIPECCHRSFTSSSFHTHNAELDRHLTTETDVAMENVNSTVKIHYGLNANESLYNNYHAYLCEARRKIKSCTEACQQWSSNYDGHYKLRFDNDLSMTIDNESLLAIIKDFQIEHANLLKQNDYRTSNMVDSSFGSSNKEHDSLQSISESSGYESFRYRPDYDDDATPDGDLALPDDEQTEEFAEESFWKNERPSEADFDDSFPESFNSDLNPAHYDVGPLLKTLFNKLKTMIDNDLYVNIRLTGVISRLAAYPSPLLRSLLLCPWIVLQPTVPSLFQIISATKQQIDNITKSHAETADLMEEARNFLIEREIALANARRNAIMEAGNNSHVERKGHPNQNESTHVESPTNLGQPIGHSTYNHQSPPTPPPTQEVFKRNESKRRSLSSSITSMFRNKLNSAGALNNSMVMTASPSSRVSASAMHDPPTSKTLNYHDASYWQTSKIKKAVIAAIILEEWLKELAALSQEHAVSPPEEDFAEMSHKISSL